MTIQLTNEQWMNIEQAGESPPRVSDPSQSATFVLLRADVYERFKSLFDNDPITDEEKRLRCQQFGKRAGWDDAVMDVYDDLDPRRIS